MKKTKLLLGLGFLAAAGVILIAADYIDAPSSMGTTADIADFYGFEPSEGSDNTVFVVDIKTNVVPDLTYVSFDETVLTEINIDLDSIKNMSDFDYLIRWAKWNDHKGDLETAIRFMETAKVKAESFKNTTLMLWSYTNLDSYAIAVENPDYGAMYNVYNVGMYLEQPEQYNRALKVAEMEVNNRPTPGSYDLLAYSYYKLGEKDKALKIINQHIEGKTFEPGILYRTAEIYKASGEYLKVRELKNELMGAIYELGPAMESKIINL